MSNDLRAGLIVLGIVTATKLALAAWHDLLADEAYYWVWSLRPAFGYYDQPPFIAWVLAAARQVGDHAFALRAPGILACLAAPLVLLPHAGDKGLWLLWWAALPPLTWLGLFATPDALLLPLWALALAGALRGGRGWVLAGVAAGLAVLTKHSGLAVLPLLILAADAEERRSVWPWIGLVTAALIAAPNLAWNVAHDWVTLRFQLGEGLVHPHAPGLLGPPLVALQQVAVVTPIAALAGLGWLLRRPRGRTERMAWLTSAPLLAFFAVCAVGAPPDAHWPAPAWIGIGLGLSHAGGRLGRAASLGAALALLASGIVAVHSVVPLVPLAADPGDRLREGRALADQVERWVLPEGAASGERLDEVLPVFTERYQEAALLHWHTGVPARTWPGCGRASQYDLEPVTLPTEAWMIRPATSGPDLCSDRTHPDREGPHLLQGIEAGRTVGRWQLFRVRSRE